eukprot:Colp12_sorted_trinity150504_noHs@2818
MHWAILLACGRGRLNLGVLRLGHLKVLLSGLRERGGALVTEAHGVSKEEQNGPGHEGGPGANGNNIDDLVNKLHAIAVEGTVIAGLVNLGGGKETSKEGADHTTNTVGAEHKQRVVDHLIVGITGPCFENGIGNDGGDDTHNDGMARENIAAGGGDHDKTDNSTVQCTLKRRVASDDEIQDCPGEHSSTSTDLSVGEGDSGSVVGGKGRATVEAEPAKPQKGSTEKVEGHIGRALGVVLGKVILFTTADHLGGNKGGETGSDMDDGTTGKVKGTLGTQPAVNAPHPVGNEVVDKDGPEQDEDKEGRELHTTDNTTNDQRWCDNGKGHLEHHENKAGNSGGIHFTFTVSRVLNAEASKSSPTTITDKLVARRESEGVAEEHPLNSDQAHGDDGFEHGLDSVVCVHKRRVEERKAEGHQEHEPSARENPGSVTGVHP